MGTGLGRIKTGLQRGETTTRRSNVSTRIERLEDLLESFVRRSKSQDERLDFHEARIQTLFETVRG
jgi:hypothetical protein